MRSLPLRSDCRWLVAALLVEIAAIHISLVPQHLREAPYAGALFIALSTASLGLAALMLARDHPMVWAAAAAVALGAIVAYLVSRSVGLPMMDDDIGDWLNALGAGALCAEAITVAISAAVLAQLPHATQRPAMIPPG